jgi:hypothetical protein
MNDYKKTRHLLSGEWQKSSCKRRKLYFTGYITLPLKNYIVAKRLKFRKNMPPIVNFH